MKSINLLSEDCKEPVAGKGCHALADAVLFGRAALDHPDATALLSPPPAVTAAANPSAAVLSEQQKKPVFQRVLDPSQLEGLEGTF